MNKNMKRLICLLFILFPLICLAQGNKGTVESCAPMKKGKVCYEDVVEMKGFTQDELYNNINKWAKREYGSDIFISNTIANRAKKTIMINSKIELLLGDDEKSILKYKMYISCHDNEYRVEVRDLTFFYDPEGRGRVKRYIAESILANNGKGNKVPAIKIPEVFCNATFFFVEGLFGDVLEAAKGQ